MRKKMEAYLAFAGLYVPVGVASVASPKDIKFRMLHDDCGVPVKQAWACSSCGELVSGDQIVKGYEIAKDTFVYVEKEKLESFAAPRNRVIELDKFVPIEQVSNSIINKSDWLIPSEHVAKPYQILYEALAQEGMAGIGVASLHGKEHPVAVASDHGVLMLHTLFNEDELIPSAEIVGMLETVDVKREEVELTKQFLHLKKGDLKATDLLNVSRSRVMGYIESLAAGKELESPEAEEPEVPAADYMALMREAVAAAQ